LRGPAGDAGLRRGGHALLQGGERVPFRFQGAGGLGLRIGGENVGIPRLLQGNGAGLGSHSLKSGAAGSSRRPSINPCKGHIAVLVALNPIYGKYRYSIYAIIPAQGAAN